MPIFEFYCGACLKFKYVMRAVGDSMARVPYCDNCVIPMVPFFEIKPNVSE